MVIVQNSNALNIKSFTTSEWSDDEISEQSLTLDGKDNNSVVFMNSPRVQIANWSAEKDTLTISSKVSVKYVNNPSEIKSKEVWTTQKRGKKLVIVQTSDGFMGRGPAASKLVYNKY
jgi:hypothetical protein